MLVFGGVGTTYLVEDCWVQTWWWKTHLGKEKTQNGVMFPRMWRLVENRVLLFIIHSPSVYIHYQLRYDLLHVVEIKIYTKEYDRIKVYTYPVKFSQKSGSMIIGLQPHSGFCYFIIECMMIYVCLSQGARLMLFETRCCARLGN